MKNHHKGFTIIELMITVAMVSIMILIGEPGFKQIVMRDKVSSLSMEFVGTIRLAQSESIRRGIKVSIAPHSTTQWEDGWDIFVDGSTVGVKDTDDELIKTYTPNFNKSTLRSSDNIFASYITFLPNGSATGNAGSYGSFILCPPDKDIKNSRTIEIERSGNISNNNNTLHCH